MRAKSSAVLLTALAAATIAGCSTSTPGKPTAQLESSSTTATDRPTKTTSQSSNSLADINPCDMLTSAVKAQLRITDAGKPSDVGSGRGCDWHAEGTKRPWVLSVTLYDKLAADDVSTDLQVKPLPDINNRKAVQITDKNGLGECTVSVAVTKSSSLAAMAMADGDEAKGCEVARTMAELIEPTLPRQ
ncbi:DUF3558 domain-containing protein [Actinokineospora auranticolor]|uniref:Uncharacterized protein DUF3558 n=1 Tax=Actinokineospora auranticolor TaxID=155976 RepID=A0A2S6GN76_9PSEU|nr:DUF3558 domain-containing protein [Actinokineospora auranticolor]PPK66678.1 uncharacterized protein DUF3558 [Actinokineospora auranticolor]